MSFVKNIGFINKMYLENEYLRFKRCFIICIHNEKKVNANEKSGGNRRRRFRRTKVV